MMTRVPDTRNHESPGENSRTSALWTVASAGGAFVGCIVALRAFPEAAFARNPTGVFGWYLVGFALAIGLGFAIAQWMVLSSILRRMGVASSLCRHLWLPLSAAGIVAMLLPLWWLPATVFVLLPVIAFVPMLPGIVLLGAFQGALTHCIGGPALSWAIRTIIGAAIGSVAGLLAAFLAAGVSYGLIPAEAVWAAVTAGVIGALQGRLLDKGLLRNRS